MDQKGYPSKNVHFHMRERVQIAAVPCLKMLLGRLIILLPSGPKHTNAPIFLQPPSPLDAGPQMGLGDLLMFKKNRALFRKDR